METKICGKCKKSFPKTPEYFAGRTDRKEGTLQLYCKKCQKEYRRNHYLENKKEYVKKATAYTKTVVTWFKTLKDGKLCEICGENRPWVLDYHHIDPSLKSFTIGGSARTVSKKRLIEEIKKCKILCANCHRDLHHKEELANNA